MEHLPSDTVQRLAKLERKLEDAQALAKWSCWPTERMRWQARARTIQAQIEVLETMAQSSQQAFGELERARQEELA